MKTKTKEKTPREPDIPPVGYTGIMKIEDIATALRVSRRTVESMISTGEFPRQDFYVRSLPRWCVETFNAWVAERSRKA